MAGESAEAVARRQREKAARLERSAELWQRGAEGERATAAALDALPRQWWTVVHDVAWPGRPRANIDHVAVGPPGVFVIDSKHWSGAVTLTSGGMLRQSGRSRATSVAGVQESARAVAGLLLPAGAPVVRGVLCLTGEGQASGDAGSVTVCPVGDLSGYLQSLAPTIPETLLPELATQVTSLLEPAEGRSVLPSAAGLSAEPGAPVSAAMRTAERPPSPPGRGRRTTSRSTATHVPSGFSVLRLLKPAVVAAVLLVMITQPQIITSVASSVSGMFVSRLVPEVPTAPDAEPSAGVDDNEMTKKERRQERREQNASD